MGDHAPKAAPAPKKPSPKLNMTVVLWIAAGAAIALALFFGYIGQKKAEMNPQGPAAVQTGPVQQPAQAAPVATDPCAGNPAVTVTARPAGTTPEWVSIPMGHCEAVPQTPGMGISYTRVCLNTKRETDTTGLCPDGAYAVGYQSTSSRTIQVTTRFRYNP